MQRVARFVALLPSFLALHIHCNSRGDVRLGTNAVHRLLHLAVTAVAAFHGVGCRRKKFVVEKRQRLFQVGREQLLQGLADPFEASHASPQSREFFERCFAAAAAIKKAIDLIHDVSKRSQFGPPASDAVERSPPGRSQVGDPAERGCSTGLK